jgi:hypothetical protein
MREKRSMWRRARPRVRARKRQLIGTLESLERRELLSVAVAGLDERPKPLAAEVRSLHADHLARPVHADALIHNV